MPPEAETRAYGKQQEQPKAIMEFAIAQDPIWKKQDQEQKRFLRRSHGELNSRCYLGILIS